MRRNNNSKNIIAEIRVFIRILAETTKGFIRAGWMNLIIITTMAAILSIFGCLFRTSMAVSSLIESIGSDLEISVYIKPDASTRRVIGQVKSINHVQKVKLITKENAWEDMKKQYKVPNISNPLPDTLHVRLENQEFSESVIKQIKNIRGIEDIRFSKDLANRIRLISDIGHAATLIVLIILGSLTMFIISNTIQLEIQSKKAEIEIMRLMGVNNWYIKAPFIFQGCAYGITGALLALIPLNILQGYLDQASQFFGVASNEIGSQIVMLSLFAMGAIVGAGGSFISVKKYLDV